MRIQVLPPQVASAIAAGEVVERPSSVVKELVENSLDAGATAVTVELSQGGMDYIRVTDNGGGIPADEVELAFARHATSKLREAEELQRITSMGFRGEALPSIAAVGRVTMVTRSPEAAGAASVEMEEGAVVRRGTTGAAPGTSVTVEGLFSHVPARRKYLRSPAAETARVRQVVAHTALAFPWVQFTLRTDDRTVLQTPGNGSARDVLSVLHGTETAAALLEVSPGRGAAYAVGGFIGPGELSRSNRTAMSLFVNRRWVQSPPLLVAVEEAYRGFLTEGQHPVSALFLEVPPSEVDVNVHPTKREVRFAREGDAFSSVQRAVRETLLTSSPLAQAVGPVPSRETIGPAPDSLGTPSFQFTVKPGAVAPRPDAEGGERASPAKVGMPALRVLGQMAGTYVVAEGPDGMYLIDQHAAHEQVLFERVVRQWREHQPEVQGLLEPLPLELSPEQLEVVEAALPALEEYGFRLEPFGDGAWLVRTVPAVARQVLLPRLIGDLLELLRHRSDDGSPPHRWLATSIACHSAVRAGDVLEHQQMVSLVRSLETAENPRHCPHGRPTTIRVAMELLEREFRRT